MILIADSGSTKTTWALVEETRTRGVIETRGMNPYFTSPDEMALIITNELLPRLVDQPIRSIYFYGAGCSATKNIALIHHQLLVFFPLASITVEHDILGAARSIFGKNNGIACILGTGSNSCF